MLESDVYSALTEILRDLFMNDDLIVTPDLSANRVHGWDSFKQIEIILATEERFGVKFTTQEVESLKCVGDLSALILKHTV